MIQELLHSDMTAPSLLGLAVILVLLGIIVPRPTYKEKAREAERWRLAYEAEREARSKTDEHFSDLFEVCKATQAVIEAVFGSRRSRVVRPEAEKPDETVP